MEVRKDIKVRYESTRNALNDLAEIIDIIANDPVGKSYYKHMRKSEIQSFEFSLDTFWKLLKEYLLLVYKVEVDIATPKKVFRACLNIKVVTQEEFDMLLDAVDARNITSHTYQEELAEAIARQMPKFYKVLDDIFKRLVID